MEPVPRILPHEHISKIQRLKEYWRAFKLYRKSMKDLGDDLPQVVELLTGAATPILDRYFESDILKATLATDAIIGSFNSPHNAGTAYVLLHHVMGETGGSRGVWGYVQGGMGGIANALQKVCEDLGVVIHCDQPVERIVVDKGRVQGVLTLDGKFTQGNRVLSNLDANVTFNKMVGLEKLPEYYRNRINNISYSSASVKINLALDSLPEFKVKRDGQMHGTVHFTDCMFDIEQAYHEARIGGLSEEPVIEMTVPSTLDDSLAPEGKHVVSMFVQYCPYMDDPEANTDYRKMIFDNCLDVMDRYCDIRKRIVGHETLTPVDLESRYGLTGGNIFQGEMSIHQLGKFRLDHRTPVKGLYLCGAATHPGGGVMGACGKNAAIIALTN